LFTTRLVICANKVNRFNFDFTGTLSMYMLYGVYAISVVLFGDSEFGDNGVERNKIF